ncbi:MAG: hypothetical protein MUE53_02935 [Chitinophagales bacterium]|jgi:hypothetical protein|nr:hypothetical protein [Chitinophagales bacterium]
MNIEKRTVNKLHAIFGILLSLFFCLEEIKAQQQWIDSLVILPGASSNKVLMSDANGLASWRDLPSDSTQAGNGLTMNGKIVELGGTLNRLTTIANLSNTNKFRVLATGTDVFSVDGTTFSLDANNNRIGIGTNSPQQALDVNGNIRFTGALMPNNLPGTAGQVLTSSGPDKAPVWRNTYKPNFGDVKLGFQPVDHSGWIRLDGRAVNTLTPSQQNIANFLGIGANIPNADNAILSQNNAPIGAFVGQNTRIINTFQLPTTAYPINATSGNAGNHNHYVGGTNRWTSTDGNHQHGYWDDGCCGTVGWVGIQGGGPARRDATNRGSDWNGNHNHTVDVGNVWTDTRGEHNHTITGTVRINTDATQQPIVITPRTMSVNVFLYLGD